MRLLQQRLCMICATILSLGIFFALTGTSFAMPNHAKVSSSDPGINSTIAKAPNKVTVTALENMKPGPANSNLFVYGPSGDLISQGDAKVDLNNPKQMSVNIKPEKNGVYVVRWTTVSSDDNDPAQGAFVFTVGTATGSSAQQAQPTAAPKASAPAATTTSSSNSGPSIWTAVISGAIALLVGLGVGFGLGRTRQPAPTADEPTRTPVS
ncbi:copper resistance CopC family protein [Dictyobacter aurantiacus]|uniref:CopC domain-containing protein n=1 Tax=Dictyobacter aurantiacus TaxID=1936993 RepID=A0A401ZNE7_9CHLR|nr:copper resistance protein CopC [Dictyobacter aurantiacus]GCE08381.1 hypothetical protein KDAU_57100 [Dictyobacter aurantiacus]